MKPRKVRRLVRIVAHHRAGPFRRLGLGVVVMGDQAAHRHARKRVEQREHRLEHRAADILEIDVDALRAGVLQLGGQIRIAVVETGIEAELLHDVVALVLAAGDADRACALDLGDLAHGRADRTGSAGDDDGLALLAACRYRAGPYTRSCRACRARRQRSRSARALDRSCASPLPSEIACVCQPARESTMSPLAKFGLLEAATSQTVPASITPPIGTGAA